MLKGVEERLKNRHHMWKTQRFHKLKNHQTCIDISCGEITNETSLK